MGRLPVGNEDDGVVIADNARSTVVGGVTFGAGNVISGNGRDSTIQTSGSGVRVTAGATETRITVTQEDISRRGGVTLELTDLAGNTTRYPVEIPKMGPTN